jgi:hypothetical protein
LAGRSLFLIRAGKLVAPGSEAGGREQDKRAWRAFGPEGRQGGEKAEKSDKFFHFELLKRNAPVRRGTAIIPF